MIEFVQVRRIHIHGYSKMMKKILTFYAKNKIKNLLD